MGQTVRALQSIKVGADYITSCSISDSEFVVQVGTYALDLVDLNSPEDMTQARPVYTVNATNPGGTVDTLLPWTVCLTHGDLNGCFIVSCLMLHM